MNIIQKFRQYFSRKLLVSKPENPETAYNLWSEKYDNQPDNLMLALDEEVFSGLINNINIAE